MFKKLALFFVIGLVGVTQALAQETKLPLATVQQCDLESGKILGMVQSPPYDEIPFLQGETMIRAMPSGAWLNANFYMLMNPQTKTFSIILSDPTSGMECLWLAGKVQPVIQGGDKL